MSKNDGGPAFPRDGNCSNGMTLRQYYAGQALVGMAILNVKMNLGTEIVARYAVDLADALIAELEK